MKVSQLTMTHRFEPLTINHSRSFHFSSVGHKYCQLAQNKDLLALEKCVGFLVFHFQLSTELLITWNFVKCSYRFCAMLQLQSLAPRFFWSGGSGLDCQFMRPGFDTLGFMLISCFILWHKCSGTQCWKLASVYRFLPVRMKENHLEMS